VTVDAIDSTATEAGPTAGTYRITRTGAPLRTSPSPLRWDGNATSGSDYAMPLSRRQSSCASFVGRCLDPVDDASCELDEEANLTLTANAAYTLGIAGKRHSHHQCSEDCSSCHG